MTFSSEPGSDRRSGRIALGAVTVLSALLLLFAVAGIARVGVDPKPSAAVVSAAQDVVQSKDYQYEREEEIDWEYVYYFGVRPASECREEAPGEHEHHCRKPVRSKLKS